MAKVRNITDDTLDLRVIERTVAPDEVVEVPDVLFSAFDWPPTVWAVVAGPRKSTKNEE